MACIAIATLAFTPFTFATSTNTGQLLRRADSLSNNLLVDRALGSTNVYKRETTQDAAARIRLAKKRASRKLKRETLSVQRRAATKPFLGGITAAFATYLDTKCSRDKACHNAEVKAQLPTDGAAVCNLETRHCVIDCKPGFLVQNDGSCFQGEISCPHLTNGIYTIIVGVCTPQCNSHLGYTLSGSSTANYKCTNTVIDKNNCGALGHRCPPSYNNIGSRQCVTSLCGLRCPVGYFQYPYHERFFYCA